MTRAALIEALAGRLQPLLHVPARPTAELLLDHPELGLEVVGELLVNPITGEVAAAAAAGNPDAQRLVEALAEALAHLHAAPPSLQ